VGKGRNIRVPVKGDREVIMKYEKGQKGPEPSCSNCPEYVSRKRERVISGPGIGPRPGQSEIQGCIGMYQDTPYTQGEERSRGFLLCDDKVQRPRYKYTQKSNFWSNHRTVFPKLESIVYYQHNFLFVCLHTEPGA